MQCQFCGRHFRRSIGPSLSCCSECYERSRGARPFRLHRRRTPAQVPVDADPRPARERLPTVILVPLDGSASDEVA
jgi:hypothetical protein